jgi:drug/metabolite transporter (DMT)-like permease
VSTNSVSIPSQAPDKAQQRRSFLLVVCCTLIGAAAQILIKRGAGTLGENPTMVQTALAMVLNPALLAGFSMYGVSMVLLVMAVLSVLILHESMNAFKLAGIAIIVGGIAVLGKGSSA